MQPSRVKCPKLHPDFVATRIGLLMVLAPVCCTNMPPRWAGTGLIGLTRLFHQAWTRTDFTDRLLELSGSQEY